MPAGRPTEARQPTSTRRSTACILTPVPGHGPQRASGAPALAAEVKCHARLTPALLRAWWRQTEAQAHAAGLFPVLAYRLDRAGWRIVAPLHVLRPEMPALAGVDQTVEMPLPAFATVVRENSGPRDWQGLLAKDTGGQMP